MELVERITEEVNKNKNEIIGLAQELVRVPSFSSDAQGLSQIAQIIAEEMKRVGLTIELTEAEKGLTNVIGTFQGSDTAPCILFNGHTDVVPAQSGGDWIVDPFSAEIKDGRIYGRGSCDMKSGLVAQTMAATALQRAGVKLRGDLILESVVGEEVMDHEAGTTATVRRGYKADAAIVTEPSASATTPLTVVPVSPGVLWMTVTCVGKASHASNRGETIRAGGPGAKVGVNAIDKGALILNALYKLEDEWGMTKKHHLFNPGHFTMLPGVIKGAPIGVDVPFIISEYCTIEYAIWYHPDDTEETVKREVEEQIRHAAAMDGWLRDNPPEVKWNLNWPPFNIPEDHPICQTIGRAHEQAAKGTRFEGPYATTGFYAVDDGVFLQAGGIPAVTYGPGHIHQAHQIDEYVNIDEMITATKAYALAMMDWCGVA